MKHIGLVAVGAVGLLTVAYLGGVEPLYIALGVIGLLGYLAFAGGEDYKKKPQEQKRAWYMD